MEKSECVYKTSREIKVSVPAQELINTLLDDIITERVSDMVSEDHDGNGIVIPGSVNVISRTPLYQDLTRFDGAYACHARYAADCYDAPKGMTTTATVRVTLPNGILCEKEMPEMRHPVFRVFLPYEVHGDTTRDKMRTLIRDQVIRFRSIQRYGGLGDKTIDVLGEFVDTIGDVPIATNPASAQLRGKESLRVEDFRAPRGADSDDPAVINEHQAEMGEEMIPTEKESSDEPAPTIATTESAMYDLWLKYNVALAKSHKREASDFSSTLVTSIRSLGEKKKMWYDPVNRRFTAYLKGLDAPASYPHYLYRALPNDNIGSIRGGLMIEPADYIPVAEYSFVVTHPGTLKHTSAVDILQKSLPRRLYGVVPTNVLILSFLDDPRIAFEPINVSSVEDLKSGTSRITSHIVRIERHKLSSGTAVGEQLVTILKDMYDSEDIPDLIVLDARYSPDVPNEGEEESKSLGEDPQVVLDAFVPTYPLVVDTNVLVFTPSQASQCKGNYVSAKSPMDTLQSFIGCAATELGGHIQRPPGSAGSITVRPEKPLSMKVTPVIPDTIRSVPTIEHGWMSMDTHAALVGTMRTLQPKSVFELGSWYGLSTRVILGEAKETTVYAFDKFKAPPLLGYDKKRIGVEDNFFFNYPRYETFAANVSTALTGLGIPSGAAAASAGSSSSRNKVYMIKGDASKVVSFASSNRIAPEVVFIDFEKNTARLKTLIKNLRSTFPQVVIVGDDHIFDSVKRAVRSLPKKNTIVFEESYIVLPDDFPVELRETLKESIESTREELKDTETQATVRKYIKEGKIGDVLRAYPAGESVSSPIPHTQAQMALHEAIRVTKNKYPDAITDEVLRELLDDSQHWSNGSANFTTLTPWDYITHKLSFFRGEDTTE